MTRVKKGILFDLDGTLWNAVPQITAAFNQVLSRRPELNRRVDEAELRGYMGRTRLEIAERLLPMVPPERWYDMMEEFFAEELVYLKDHHAAPYPCLKETLERLSGEYALAVVSNCQTGYIETFFDTLDVGRYFCDSQCADTGLSKGENIRLVLERTGIGRGLYLGDTQSDLDAAAQAGLPFVHAAYGFGSVDRDTLVIHSLPELPGLARELLG